MNNYSDEDFFLNRGVVKSFSGNIEARFETLIESKKDKPFDWYQALGLHKSNASRIKRGLIIPPEWLRIKIAAYFGVDSSVIWKVPEIISADKLKLGDTNGSD